ncbi:unnamed protein product [Fraxinus pennsylvanica]|uniref:GST N-terminal domain-containing protein n=1 Tax=Fraxinus pennsylvanica TaxID=56036 RepID=A0AAD2DKU9_9LAMI|nr:unnamed protein product [Fraxinus pennsylvanica]
METCSSKESCNKGQQGETREGSSTVQRQYGQKFGFNETIPVAVNDVSFSIHAIFFTALTLFEIAIYDVEFLKLNPLGYVPVLLDDDFVLADSFARLMYLEEKYPQHPLLPKDLQKMAQVIWRMDVEKMIGMGVEQHPNLLSRYSLNYK